MNPTIIIVTIVKDLGDIGENFGYLRRVGVAAVKQRMVQVTLASFQLIKQRAPNKISQKIECGIIVDGNKEIPKGDVELIVTPTVKEGVFNLRFNRAITTTNTVNTTGNIDPATLQNISVTYANIAELHNQIALLNTELCQEYAKLSLLRK